MEAWTIEETRTRHGDSAELQRDVLDVTHEAALELCVVASHLLVESGEKVF